MTVGAAVLLDDGRVFCATDAAVGYSDGYRRPMTTGKWWDEFSDRCWILESGTDLALARIRAKLRQNRSAKLEDAHVVASLLRKVQDEMAGKDAGVEGLDAELLHIASSGEIHVLGGDGGVIGPYPYTAIGHGAPVVNPILEYEFPTKTTLTERVVRTVLKRAFQVCTIYCDSVHGWFEHIYE
jgi:hypothetical protein